MSTVLTELARLGMTAWVKAPGKLGLKELRSLDQEQIDRAMCYARAHKDILLKELSPPLLLNRNHKKLLALLVELEGSQISVTIFGLCNASNFQQRVDGTAEGISLLLDELIQAGKVQATEGSISGTIWIELP